MGSAEKGRAPHLTDYPDKPRACVDAGYIGCMTTFAGQMDFSGPQPFNVSIEAEEAVGQPVGAPILGPSLPVVVQEITPEPNLYAPIRHGVANGAIR